MASEKSKSDTNSSEIDWTPENEIKLFYAMRGHKPVGVAKNFHMIAILDEFGKLTEKEISSTTIWSRLSKLYDMDTLHENEDLPFPNQTIPFTIEGIPEFDELIAKKRGIDCNKSEKEVDIKDETEVMANCTKTGTKSKAQESSKTNPKSKVETEKNTKSDRKDETVKQSEKVDEIEDKSMRSKKPVLKQTPELRHSSHSTTSSAKKRK